MQGSVPVAKTVLRASHSIFNHVTFKASFILANLIVSKESCPCSYIYISLARGSRGKEVFEPLSVDLPELLLK